MPSHTRTHKGRKAARSRISPYGNVARQHLDGQRLQGAATATPNVECRSRSTQNPVVPIDWNGLAYARSQMGISLAFHIVFAAAGVALPALMVLADLQHRRTRDPEYLLLSKQLAKGTSILFAVGAVSGTVLSFELGLLWPRFMGTIRRIDRAAVRARGLRVLHRGDLPRHLSVRARQGVAGPAPRVRRRGRGQRRGVGAVRHAGERVHERTGRRRSDRRDGQPVVAVPGRARAALLLPGDRVGDGRDPRVHPAARSRRERCTARRWRSRCRWRA